MNRYDSWLQAPYYENDDDFLNERKDELLNEKYDVRNFDNFYDALCDIGVKEYNELKAKVGDLLHDRNFEQLGRVLWNFACDELEERAENEAVEDYNSNNRD